MPWVQWSRPPWVPKNSYTQSTIFNATCGFKASDRTHSVLCFCRILLALRALNIKCDVSLPSCNILLKGNNQTNNPLGIAGGSGYNLAHISKNRKFRAQSPEHLEWVSLGPPGATLNTQSTLCAQPKVCTTCEIAVPVWPLYCRVGGFFSRCDGWISL